MGLRVSITSQLSYVYLTLLLPRKGRSTQVFILKDWNNTIPIHSNKLHRKRRKVTPFSKPSYWNTWGKGGWGCIR